MITCVVPALMAAKSAVRRSVPCALILGAKTLQAVRTSAVAAALQVEEMSAMTLQMRRVRFPRTERSQWSHVPVSDDIQAIAWLNRQSSCSPNALFVQSVHAQMMAAATLLCAAMARHAVTAVPATGTQFAATDCLIELATQNIFIEMQQYSN